MILLALAIAVGFIILATTRLQLHPAIALLLAALAFGAMTGMDGIELVNQVTTGFGATIGQIGIVIMAGAIIGTFLEKSGGVLVLARAILKRVGQKQVPATMTGIGFITSIPVFGDTGFIILASLNRALARMAGTSFAAGTIALALGLIASHTMVPPTPGPIATAALLDANLGLVILLGLFTGVISAFVGWLFATRFAARTPLDPGEFLDEAEAVDIAHGDAPGTVHSALPIIVPLVLILLGSLAALPSYPLGQGVLASGVAIAGHPVIALFVGILIAITLPRKFELPMLGTTGWVGQAIANCATVILITGAGGAFGKVLQGSEIADVVGGAVQSAQIGLFLPFLLAAALKTAQGSSTVAMLTAAGLTAPLLPAMGLDSEMARALAVVAIGAGSAVVSHTNDSFFWVVTQTTGMTVRKGLKLLSFGTLVMGSSAAVVVWLLGQVLI